MNRVHDKSAPTADLYPCADLTAILSHLSRQEPTRLVGPSLSGLLFGLLWSRQRHHPGSDFLALFRRAGGGDPFWR